MIGSGPLRAAGANYALSPVEESGERGIQLEPISTGSFTHGERGNGGVKFFTNQALTAGVELAPGGSGWNVISDVNRKENFEALDGEEVLLRLRDVPVMTWNYKTQDATIRHAGPTARDFHAAFGLGESELMINTIDIDGIKLAAIKALEERTRELQEATAEIQALRAEAAAQKQRIEGLERQQKEILERLERLEKRR